MKIEKAYNKLIKLKGKPLRELAEQYNVNTDKHKGWKGHCIELFLGSKPNSIQEADFGDWELKQVKLYRGKRGQILFSSTVCITLVNNKQVANTSFEDSHLLNKIKKVLFVFTVDESIYDVKIFSINKEMYEQARKDYRLIQYFIKQGKKLSGRIGNLIQTRPKGSGKWKGRAFFGKSSFIKYVLGIKE